MSINLSKRTVTLNKNKITLTKKEFDLLYFLVLNKSMIFSRDTLLDKVWKDIDINDMRTVDAHIKNLRKSLSGYGKRIKTVWGVGYKFE